MALAKAKHAKALKAARAHPKLKAVLDRGGRVVLAAQYVSGRADGDQVVIGVHDPAGSSLVALVDATRGRVVSVERTPARFQLDDAEQREAERLAAADERVRRFLGRRPMSPLTRLTFPPGADSGHRHAIVFLRPTPSRRAYAIVDLTDGRVIDVLDRHTLTGAAG